MLVGFAHISLLYVPTLEDPNDNALFGISCLKAVKERNLEDLLTLHLRDN